MCFLSIFRDNSHSECGRLQVLAHIHDIQQCFVNQFLKRHVWEVSSEYA